jgi:hypothetical protein
VQLHPHNHHPDQPAASGSHRLLHTHCARLVGNIMGHRPPHLGVLGAHFYHFLGHIPQALQRAGRTRANFRVSDLAVVSQHSYWTYLTGFGRWAGPLKGPFYVKWCLLCLALGTCFLLAAALLCVACWQLANCVGVSWACGSSSTQGAGRSAWQVTSGAR